VLACRSLDVHSDRRAALAADVGLD
jgi:hypothetical protein